MWTVEHRRAADRRGLRYPSDLTDTEWALIAPLIPPAKHGGRKRSVDVREVLNGIFYVLSTGCQWNALPKDLPPARLNASITSFTWRCATRKDARRARLSR
jgi:transposase